MAITSVSGMVFGLVANFPTIPANSTDAAKTALYEGLAPYTTSASCIITQLPIVDEAWETQQDPVTVCDDEGAIRKSFKTNRTVANGTMGFLFDKTDPLLVLFRELQASRTQVGTYEMIHQNGTDKIWGQIQVLRIAEDPTNAEGRVLANVDFFYEESPHRN